MAVHLQSGNGQVEGMPPRSQLVPLMPFGVGTPYIESLSSNFLRLADIYCVNPGTLYGYLRSPEINIKQNISPYEITSVWDQSHFLNISNTASGWTKHLEELTTVRALDRLTILPLAGRIALRGVIYNQKRWCPLCHEEAITTGAPYGQLLWQITPVTACPKHRVYLVDRCQCGNLRWPPRKQSKLLPQFCKFCGRSLASIGPLIEAPLSAIGIANLVGELLKSTLFLNSPKPIRSVAHFLREAMASIPSCTLNKIAERIGVGTCDIYNWKEGTHLPTLGSVVKLASTFDCSLESVLSGNPLKAKEPIWLDPSPKPQRGAVNNPDEMVKQLKDFLAENPPPSLAELGRRFGVHPSTIRHRFPEIARRLVDTRTQVRSAYTIKIHQERAEAYAFAAESLAIRGIRPTRERVREMLGSKYPIFLPIDRESCTNACDKVLRSLRKAI